MRPRSLIVALTLCTSLFGRTGTAQTQGHQDRKVITRVAPVYPALAKRMHVSGAVKLEIVIRPNGSVKSVTVVGGNPLLIEPATVAVQKWKFEAGPEETTEVVQLVFDPRW
ncbi:MAG TPA: energy transducer TonB [Candidatus Dormibacteraeota bacterium]|jgi:TonB family protein|nr:energy transducer TonB [Candidatus Dormibacteraeota bacterium]